MTSKLSSELQQELADCIRFVIGRHPQKAVAHDWQRALMIVARRRATDTWISSLDQAHSKAVRRVYYLSLEFLIGRILEDALRNMGLFDAAVEALADFGLNGEAIIRSETDPALGNGGLGRLAACFLESLASLGYPAMGYGIRYEQGLFRQEIVDGWQVERPDSWTRDGVNWEFRHPDINYAVGFGGQTDRLAPAPWQPDYQVTAVAHDYPVVGWKQNSVLTLRLWQATSDLPMDLSAFDRGDYVGATSAQAHAEAISQILYPNDSSEEGKRMRLSQEYFFCAASIKDILHRHLAEHETLASMPEFVSIQLNDTHPAIAIPELVRLLMDDHHLDLAQAWELARGCFNYTNHTLLPEALESWSLGLMASLLPRHLQIIYEINALVLNERRNDPTNSDMFLSDISMIDEHGGGSVRMGHLAFLGSQKTNGVSALHSQLVEQQLFAPLERHFPGKITNVTNGVTPRRWLNGCNPRLAKLLTQTNGDDYWCAHLSLLSVLEDQNHRQAFGEIKRQNKQDFAAFLASKYGVTINPDAMIDVQIKRIHEYKRQLLNLLHGVALYLQIKEDGFVPAAPRVKIISGKAAASYTRAKEIIRLAHALADICAQDPLVSQHLQIVFLPDYNVSLAERIVPATDLSEQISTAGMEASGTGNMKFALNGALTIGTLDGANVEIRDAVGAENFELFGLEAHEVQQRRMMGACPSDLSDPSHIGARVLKAITRELFTDSVAKDFMGLVNDLRHHDYYLVMADFEDYLAAQARVEASFANTDEWTNLTYLNTARMGFFSSDRAIDDYAQNIWRIKPLWSTSGGAN